MPHFIVNEIKIGTKTRKMKNGWKIEEDKNNRKELYVVLDTSTTEPYAYFSSFEEAVKYVNEDDEEDGFDDFYIEKYVDNGTGKFEYVNVIVDIININEE